MGQLAEAYRRHFGGTQSPMQLYGGFIAFFMGAALGLMGILLVIGGEPLIQDSSDRYKAGILMASLGMPLLFMGLQMTLPSRWAIHAFAGIGAAVCLLGVWMFYQAWPHQWNQSDVDRSGQVIGIYTLGLVLLVTTTAMALVVNFISRHMVLPGQELADDLFNNPDREVSMDEVMRDIEREVARQKLTWGGMEGDRLPREFLKLKADFGPDATVSHGRAGKVTETLANEMDVAFTSLARLRGLEGREVSGDDDTSVAIDALRALRQARQAELESSWWYRFKRWLVTLFTGKPATKAEAQNQETGNSAKDKIPRAPENKDPRTGQEAVDLDEEESGSTRKKAPGVKAR